MSDLGYLGNGSRSTLTLAVLLLVSLTATAHESRPILIEFTELASEVYRLHWKVPPSVSSFQGPDVTLPESCKVEGSVREVSVPDGLVRRLRAHCPDGIAGKRLEIRYAGPNPSVSTLVRYRNARGEQYTAVLGPNRSTWTVPVAESTRSVAREYAWLGINHILAGVDHLLFLVCLLWIAGGWRRTLTMITGFTLAHSITLSLSALNVVRLAVPPVEASIALSIVFLATEIAKGRSDNLTWRYPIAVSSSFGVLHGFGFAAALKDIGLPKTEVLTGLFFFNVGVEIGQAAFAAMIVAVMLVGRRVLADALAVVPRRAARIAISYSVGALATWWMIERIWASPLFPDTVLS